MTEQLLEAENSLIHMKAGDILRVGFDQKENEAVRPLNPAKIYLIAMFYNFAVQSRQGNIFDESILEYAVISPIDSMKTFYSLQISEGYHKHNLRYISDCVFSCVEHGGMFGAQWGEVPCFNSNVIKETSISVTKFRRMPSNKLAK